MLFISGAPAPADMAADVRRMAKKLRTFYCGHSGHFTADMPADLSAGVRRCPQVSAGVRWCPLVCPQVSAGPKCPQCPQIFAKNCGHLRPCPLQTYGVKNWTKRIFLPKIDRKLAKISVFGYLMNFGYFIDHHWYHSVSNWYLAFNTSENPISNIRSNMSSTKII